MDSAGLLASGLDQNFLLKERALPIRDKVTFPRKAKGENIPNDILQPTLLISDFPLHLVNVTPVGSCSLWSLSGPFLSVFCPVNDHNEE